MFILLKNIKKIIQNCKIGREKGEVEINPPPICLTQYVFIYFSKSYYFFYIIIMYSAYMQYFL